MKAADIALETPRLRLRLTARGDAALYRSLYGSSEVMRHIHAPLDAQAADTAFERVCRHNTRAAPGHRYWTILERCNGEALGLAALQRAGERAELGIMLLPHAWGRGVAREVFATLVPHAFAGMGLVRLDAERPDDTHAQVIDRLLLPLGFQRAAPENPAHARWTLDRDRWVALGFPCSPS